MGQKMKCAGLVVLLWALLGFNLIILGCVTPETMPVEIVKEAVPENALKVGVSPTAPPIIFKQNGRVTGLEAEFARELGKFIGKAVSFVEVEWEDLEMDWEAYAICVQWCKDSGIFSIVDLKDRIINHHDYQKLWLDRCKVMQEKLEAKRAKDC